MREPLYKVQYRNQANKNEWRDLPALLSNQYANVVTKKRGEYEMALVMNHFRLAQKDVQMVPLGVDTVTYYSGVFNSLEKEENHQMNTNQTKGRKPSPIIAGMAEQIRALPVPNPPFIETDVDQSIVRQASQTAGIKVRCEKTNDGKLRVYRREEY